MWAEITKEAFFCLVGENPKSILGTHRELYKTLEYSSKGVRLKVLHNYVSNVNQYYILDINS